MDRFAAEQPSTSASDHPGVTDRTERRCVLFGCLDPVAWIVRTHKAGSCPPARSMSTWSSTTRLAGCRWTATSGWRSAAHEATLRTRPGPRSYRRGSRAPTLVVLTSVLIGLLVVAWTRLAPLDPCRWLMVGWQARRDGRRRRRWM
jgi:hypothetical protein